MRLVQQNITSAVQVQFIYDDTKRYFIRRNLIKVIFGKQKNTRKLFIFGGVIPECQYSLAHIGNRRVPRQKSRRAARTNRPSTAFDIAPAITPATLYPGIILHTAGYTRGAFIATALLPVV